MNRGKDSNCVHWLYAVETGTAISIDSSIVFTVVHLLDGVGPADARRSGIETVLRSSLMGGAAATSQTASDRAPSPFPGERVLRGSGLPGSPQPKTALEEHVVLGGGPPASEVPVLRPRLDPALHDRAVRGDEEAEHGDRQCRNWPDHESGIARRERSHDPWNEAWKGRASEPGAAVGS